MRKIITTTFVTLDGVMQAPGGPDEDTTGGFEYGGWQAPFSDEVIGAFLGGLFEGPFDLLLGRKTYEIFASFWPLHVDDSPIGASFEKATKYVASRSEIDLPWANSRLLRGDVNDELRRLKQSDGPDLYVWGSGDLIDTLLEGDVIDQMNVLTYPVVVGKGKRLFRGERVARTFTVSKTNASPDGVVVTVYKPAGDIKTGTVGA